MILEEATVPRAAVPAFQHCLDTYASETNKLVATWLRFQDADWDFRIYPKSSTVGEILKHQLLSVRRFFAEFLALSERALELATLRLPQLADWQESEWLQTTNFFDVERQRVWIFWRRVLDTAHDRTQLTLYLRALDRSVPSIYGPTADETWTSADPTFDAAAAERK